MKLLILIMFCWIQAQGYSQTYSDVIPDSYIIDFAKWEMEDSVQNSKLMNRFPRRIFYKPVSWHEANWDVNESSGSPIDFESKFLEILRLDSIFSKDDFDFFKKQYYG